MELFAINSAYFERRYILLRRGVVGPEAKVVVAFSVFLAHVARRASELGVLVCETDSSRKFNY